MAPPASIQLSVSRALSDLVDGRAWMVLTAPIPGVPTRFKLGRCHVWGGDSKQPANVPQR
jgi:hypothetical protein